MFPNPSSSKGGAIRYVVVIDGEHYPPVIEDALRSLASSGAEVLGAVLVGGREKLPRAGLETLGEIQVRSGEDPVVELGRAIDDLAPDAVADLSDEPVLDYRRRHELIAVALGRGVAYEGPDFRFTPPPRPRVAASPSIAVIGTGKRTGKTAVAGFVARTLKESGKRPVVVAMGRGGPAEPELLRGDDLELSPRDLLELADRGKHAASDYIEDALLARVPTVGCRRCGGGLAGGVEVSNVRRGVELANDLDPGIIVLEGSGSALPPVHADVSILVVPAAIPAEYLAGYLGPYRVLLADFAVITMCDDPQGSPSSVSSLIRATSRAQRAGGEQGAVQVFRTVFRPHPTRPVDGARVFVATTAPETAGGTIREHLEQNHGCEVVGVSHSLSDRQRLEEELDAIKNDADLLLCEIKAAAIDVAARHALDRGLDVVFMDNLPVGVEGDDLEAMVRSAAELSVARFAGERR